jgi:ABC-type Fe3+/spermidine/putrescine transport system ATPase subunit
MPEEYLILSQTIDAARPETNAAADAYLSVNGIVKRYGQKAVVNNVSMQVRRGEVLTILGPSGCGKTTTLKMIAGFLQPDEGGMTMDGRRVDNLTSHQRGAAMVFQNYALFPHMTVRRNVAFGLRMRKQAKADIDREVDEMLQRVRLKEFAERFPSELSGGQQQRVALARALIIRPKILLLDEPFSSLDAKLRKQLRVEFLEVHRAFAITSIFVTHDLEEAFAISDRVAVMNGGVLEQLGSPSDIFARPKSRFVADFVGHKNILTGVAEPSAAGSSMFKSDDIAMLVAAGAGPITVSVPVHHVQVARQPITADNTYKAVIETVGYLGPAVQLGLRVGNQLIESYRTTTAEFESLTEGETVNVGWNAADVIVIPERG